MDSVPDQRALEGLVLEKLDAALKKVLTEVV